MGIRQPLRLGRWLSTSHRGSNGSLDPHMDSICPFLVPLVPSVSEWKIQIKSVNLQKQMKVSFSNCNYGEINIFSVVCRLPSEFRTIFWLVNPMSWEKASLWGGKDREAGKPKNDKKKQLIRTETDDLFKITTTAVKPTTFSNKHTLSFDWNNILCCFLNWKVFFSWKTCKKNILISSTRFQLNFVVVSMANLTWGIQGGNLPVWGAQTRSR